MEYYNRAMTKYLEGTEDLSRLSPDEEVKHLKEIIADKDRELEQFRSFFTASKIVEAKDRELVQKERELDQFRSCFTASTSHQRIDSLPRSLAAQTDNQETGQPPSKNNEISLCMD
uniref:Uncharacterized protein n=1 Tax=Salix viminalis TaxID=40686 RepID=A0A6N2LNX8_SALVM